jgi:hypothetical protein
MEPLPLLGKAGSFNRTGGGGVAMASIRVVDDGSQPVVEKGREAPFKQGNFYVFEVADDVARYWNKMDPGRRAQLWKQSTKEKKDVRLLVEAFVHKPAHVK